MRNAAVIAHVDHGRTAPLGPPDDLNCRAEVDSACARVFPRKTPERAIRRAPLCGGPRGLAIEEGEESYEE